MHAGVRRRGKISVAFKRLQKPARDREPRKKTADMYEDPHGQPAEMKPWKCEKNVNEAMGISALTCQDSDPDLVVVVR